MSLNRNLNARSPPRRLKCLIPGCKRWFKNLTGLSCHQRSKHNVNADPATAASHANSSRSSFLSNTEVSFILPLPQLV